MEERTRDSGKDSNFTEWPDAEPQPQKQDVLQNPGRTCWARPTLAPASEVDPASQGVRPSFSVLHHLLRLSWVLRRVGFEGLVVFLHCEAPQAAKTRCHEMEGPLFQGFMSVCALPTKDGRKAVLACKPVGDRKQLPRCILAATNFVAVLCLQVISGCCEWSSIMCQ